MLVEMRGSLSLSPFLSAVFLTSLDFLITTPSLMNAKLSDSRKPPEVIEKIVTGRMRKYYQGVCLTEQEHMVEEGSPIVVKALKELGLSVRRFELLTI